MHAVPRALALALATVLAAAIAVVVDRAGTGTRTHPHATLPPRATDAAIPLSLRPPATATPRPVATAKAPLPSPTAATQLSTSWGIDVSWPQCGPLGMPAVQPGFVAVGINDGTPFTDNPCLARELTYARTRTGVSAYLNIDAPRFGDPAVYGARVAADGIARMARIHLTVPVVWLDVEVLNHWSHDRAVNVAVINAALRALQHHGVQGGIYSSVPMWQQITGGAQIGVPLWLATSVVDYRQLPQLCDAGLGGQAAEMAQYVAWDGRQLVDVDVLCPRAIPRVVGEFAAGNG